MTKSGPSVEVRPLSNWSLPRACSLGRTRSERSDSEIARLSYRDSPSRLFSLLLPVPHPRRSSSPPRTAASTVAVRGPFPTPGWLESLASQSRGRRPSRHPLLSLSKCTEIDLWDESAERVSQLWGFASRPGSRGEPHSYTLAHAPLSQEPRSMIALRFLPERRGTLPFRARFVPGVENKMLTLFLLVSSAHPFCKAGPR